MKWLDQKKESGKMDTYMDAKEKIKEVQFQWIIDFIGGLAGTWTPDRAIMSRLL